MLIVAVALFAFIAHSVMIGAPLADVDAAFARWLHVRAHPAFTTFMLAVTHLHSQFALCSYAAILAIPIVRARQWRWLATVVLAVPCGLVINVLLKHTFERARPTFDDPLLTLETYSFPSGHVAGSVLFYGVLVAYLLPRIATLRLRAALVAAAITMVLLVAFSRMYLGVHYLSDVLGAASWSLAWLALCLTVVDGVVDAVDARRAPAAGN